MDPDELTLTGIDQMRHLVTGVLTVKAVAFAVRRCPRAEVHTGRDDRTAHRFLTALVMTATLEQSTRWPEVLDVVLSLEDGEG